MGKNPLPRLVLPMSLSIIRFPHPTLRYKSKPIRRVDSSLKDIAAEMFELMYANEGVGLAANQVDIPLRMFVVNETGRKGEGEEIVLINPELTRPKGSETSQEGCLSLPGLYGLVKRPKTIHINAYDLSGNLIDREVDGFLARVFMHENDHLDGVMFFDRMSNESVRDVEDGLDELVTDFRSHQSAGSIPSDEELIARLATWTEKYA